jgi:small nuclear ribonucleoprotein (snRNP)-like protein
MVSQLEKNAEEVNLAKHEVELAQPTDAIKEYTAQANDTVKRFDAEYKQALLKVQDIVVKYNNEIGGITNEFDKQVNMYSQKVKELGIDYNSTPFAKIAETMRKSIVSKAPYFKSILDKIKSI